MPPSSLNPQDKSALYGGSFDPFHEGHRIVIETALEAGYGPIFVCPAAQVPGKGETIASGRDRLEMTRLGTVGLERNQVDSWEITEGGISYSTQTLDYLREEKRCGHLSLLLGGDAATTLPQWRDGEQILKTTPVVIVARPGFDLPSYKHSFLPSPQLEVSSRSIRESLVKGKTPPPSWLNPLVLAHIRARGLYTN